MGVKHSYSSRPFFCTLVLPYPPKLHMPWHAMVAGLKGYYIQSVTHRHKHCTCTQMNVCDHMTLYNEKLG